MVDVNWDNRALDDLLNDPDGELGRAMEERVMPRLVALAKALAKKRTGTMASLISAGGDRDVKGMFFDLASPAQNPRSGFPYPIMHEMRRTKDRVPQPSLRPALDTLPEAVDEA